MSETIWSARDTKPEKIEAATKTWFEHLAR